MIPWPYHKKYREALARWAEEHCISVADWITIFHGVAWQMADGTAVTFCRPEWSAPLPPEWEQHLLKQCAASWGSMHLGDSPCTSTICSAGCFITSLAMAQRIYGLKADATPVTVNADLGPAGFKECNVLWSACATALGIKVGLTDTATAKADLAAGQVVMIRVIPDQPGHFVLAVEDLGGGDYLILDPYTHGLCNLLEHFQGVRSWRRLENVGIPEPQPPPPTTYTLRGTHDLEAGGNWLMSQGLKGWVTEAVYIDDGKPRTLNLAPYLNAGLRIVGRLSFSHASADGGQGTYPNNVDQAAAFEWAAAETMRVNPPPEGREDQLYWIYLNEYNNEREHPDGLFITPEIYAASYKRVRALKPTWANFALGAIDPTNAGWGDWRPVFKHMLETLEIDFLAFHAYTHNSDPALIWHHKEFDQAPLLGAYYDMRMLETQLDCVPDKHRAKVKIVTETNHLFQRDGSRGWDSDAVKWVSNAYQFFAGRVDGACLFRHNFDDWRFGGMPLILAALAAV